MEALAFSDLAPIIAAVLGPMLVFVVASMRHQHLDSTKTRDLTRDLIEASSKENRDLIEASSKENRDLIEASSKENRDLIEASSKENRELIKENGRLIEKNRDLIEKSNRETRDLLRASHSELSGSLADARERLARIEGHLSISPPPGRGVSDSGGDARAA